jgi:hypothetical protein
VGIRVIVNKVLVIRLFPPGFRVTIFWDCSCWLISSGDLDRSMGIRKADYEEKNLSKLSKLVVMTTKIYRLFVGKNTASLLWWKRSTRPISPQTKAAMVCIVLSVMFKSLIN